MPNRKGRDVIPERHNHWACGWVDGFAIRVFKGKSKAVTKAFETYCELMARLENYPVLDEEDYSKREYEECLDAIKACGRGKVLEALDDDYWPGRVYREMNVSHPDDVREKDVLKVIGELGLFDPSEAPTNPLPAHVVRTLKARVGQMTHEQATAVLTEVIGVLAFQNGNEMRLTEEVLMVLGDHGLWAED